MRHFRYLLLLVTTASMTSIYCNRIVFGFTVICQQDERMEENGTDIGDYYLDDPVNKAWMFTGTAIGMCIGPIPLYWAYRFQTSHIAFIYGTLSSLTSLLYPLADSFGFWPSILSRFFGGFGQASQLHFANEMVMRWAPEGERSLFFSICLASSQIGPLITMILGGEMCSSSFFGWRSTYYFLSIFTFSSTVLFCYLYSDDVETNRFCSPEEKSLILGGKKPSKKKAPVPYGSLLSSLGIWASFLMFSGYYVGMIIYQQYSPTFIKQVLNFSIRQTGYFSAIPMVFAIIIKVGLGKLIDHGVGLSPRWRLSIPLVFLETLSAIAIVLTGAVSDRRLALFFDMLFASLHFFVPVICSRSIQIIAGEHAHFAMNLNMFIAGFIQILLPGGVQMMVPENTREQWSILFYVVAAMISATTVIFVFCTNGRLEEWAEPKLSLADSKKEAEPNEEGACPANSQFAAKFEPFPRLSLKEKQQSKELSRNA